MNTSFKKCYLSVHRGCKYVRNNHMLIHIYIYIKKTKIFIILEVSDKRRGTRCVMDTQTDRIIHRKTRVISIVSPLLHQVTNRENSNTALTYLQLFLLFQMAKYLMMYLFIHMSIK